MGHIALPIRDAIPTTKSYEGTDSGRLLDEHPDSRTTKFYEDLPDEIAEVCLTETSFKGQVWQLFFDKASITGPQENIVARVGVVLVSLQNYVLPCAFSLLSRTPTM